MAQNLSPENPAQEKNGVAGQSRAGQKIRALCFPDQRAITS
jgi:hypothetical protein